MIDKANKIAFDNQDRVKAFKSKLQMCDNDEEIKQQMKLKRKKEEREQEIEKQWEEVEKKQMEDYDNKLKDKLEKVI